MKISNNQKLFFVLVIFSLNTLILSAFAAKHNRLNVGGMIGINIQDRVPPIITENAYPKTYFITQTSDINLFFYANAYDNHDGDLTAKIEVTSEPEFNINKAGTYNIKYNVKDSSENAATELMIQIIIWDFVKIESGYYHTLALTSHGKVYSWGYNINGELGDGSTSYRSTPRLIEGLNDIVDIAASNGSSYAVNSTGKLFSWGNNGYGKLGNNSTTSHSLPKEVLLPDGVTFTAVSSNFNNAAGLTSNGDVYTWGFADYGSAGTSTDVESYIPKKINVSNIKQVSMGYYNGAAVTRDGLLYTWGDNYHGQLGTGKTPAIGSNSPAVVPYFLSENIKIKQVSVGWYHMIAISEDGDVYTWGYGAEGRLGNGAIQDYNTPQKISLPYPASEGYAGYYHSAVKTTNNKAYFFGQNSYGKHGMNGTTNNIVPTLLESISNASQIALALDSSFVISDTRQVYGMGYGGTGVLGTGNNNNSLTPSRWSFTPPEPDGV